MLKREDNRTRKTGKRAGQILPLIRCGAVKVRAIAEQDRELFLDFSEAFYRSEAVLHRIPAEYHTRAFAELMRSDAYAEGYIAEYDGVAVGYLLTAKTYSREAGGLTFWLEEMYIVPEYRGDGIGSAMFAFIERKAVEDNVVRIRLEVEPTNKRAAALYRRLGYTDLGYRQMVKENL